MANIVFNVAKGRVVELYRRVKSADPSTAALLLVPILTASLEADSVLIDRLTLSSVLTGGTTGEQTTMGRKVLVAGDLATLPSPDTANDRYDIALPTVTWTAASGGAISKILVAYRNATADADAAIIPLTLFDFAVSPSGLDIQVTGGTFFRAS